MNSAKSLEAVAAKIQSVFREKGVKLTLGGEPTYVPVKPEGPEWSITALGPTKLRYGYALADALLAEALPQAIVIYSPGKMYPGELNPRWALNLIWNRDGTPLVPEMVALAESKTKVTAKKFEAVQAALLERLGFKRGWLRGMDPLDAKRLIAVLPLDHNGRKFATADWKVGGEIELLRTEGPAGLRLPLNHVPANISRRALTLEVRDGKLSVFLPPLLQGPGLALLGHLASALQSARAGKPQLAGYLPADEQGVWTRLAIASDPGVLEINLPPCETWQDYAKWLEMLEKAGAKVGLRSFKQHAPDEQAGTGGGNHLLFGGPSLEEHPFFTRPGWVTSILRYWQHHPALSYLFTGIYVGSSSQAPRPDECSTSLYDLEMAYQFLEQLGEGDHRFLISETIRHLHTDNSGNTHRSEISFDKFWNVAFDGGCRGLLEFRAVESLPHATWMSATALLWHALAAHLLQNPFREPLVEHGRRLHDYYFLPSVLWSDFENILAELAKSGFALPRETFRAIFDWRFPKMLAYAKAGSELTVRRAHEGWPLLCEQPLEGGSTSRFVDTSIERLEFVANRAFCKECEIRVQGRVLSMEPLGGGLLGVGLRYRRSALYPSLHPGLPPQMPLWLTITRGGRKSVFKLEEKRRAFQPTKEAAPAPLPNPCRKLSPTLLTCDLRIP
jgi:uncharacterized protein (DUF2126 family)